MITAGLCAPLILAFAWERLLERLNLRHVARHGAELPAELAARLPANHHPRALDYLRARIRLGHAAASLELLERLAWLLLLLPPLAAWSAAATPGPVSAGLLLAIVMALAGSLLQLPLEWHETFRLEARFGFNRATPRVFWTDQLKGLLLQAAIGLPALAAVLALAVHCPNHWWLAASAFLITLETLLLFLFPRLIAPLFNRFEPLPAGELRDGLEALARRRGFPLEQIVIMDGSRRSGHANAYFAGFGRHRRLVLYDTLANQLTPPELAAVVAHEIGHCKRRHLLLLGTLAALALTAGAFLACRLLAWPAFAATLRLPAGQPGAALAALGILASPVLAALAPLRNHLLRRCEYAADAYAVRATGGAAPLRAALLRLFESNLAPLRPHPLHSLWHDSHPPLPARLAAIARAAAEAATTAAQRPPPPTPA
ncbi:MAG: M48 family metallopeptidase [Lentisphaeria bacterium]|jgi:STE24 endopeptidase